MLVVGGLTVDEGEHFRKSTTGLLISNIDIDIDSIDDTFGVSISVSTILLGRGNESSIDDTFKAVFANISISILLS